MAKIYIAIVLVGLSFFGGWKVNAWNNDSKMLELEKARAAAEHALETQRNEAMKANAAYDVLLTQKNKVITHEVIKYKSSDCYVEPEWVRIHDCSVQGADTTCQPNDTPAGTFTDGDALETVTGNYFICQREINKLKGLQAWLSK